LVILVAAVALGCSSGGDDSNNATAKAACTSAGTELSGWGDCAEPGADTGALSDQNLYTFMDLQPDSSSNTCSVNVANGGTQHAAGSQAGVFVLVNLPAGATKTYTVTTSAGESASGSALQISDTQGGTDALQYIGFTTTQPFTSVTFSVDIGNNSNPSASDVRVYEVCADGHV
jgi:hypothetical protein